MTGNKIGHGIEQPKNIGKNSGKQPNKKEMILNKIIVYLLYLTLFNLNSI